ncbi:hypothetical protein DRQ20_01300 [bacterium]|nr:MAG: hypothetical protein DRQ20_01300 [bacterium]
MSEKDLTHKESGRFYLLAQRYDEAVRELLKAAEEDPHDAETFYLIGLAYEAMRKREEARKYYEKAVEIDPEHELAQERLKELIGG